MFTDDSRFNDPDIYPTVNIIPEHVKQDQKDKVAKSNEGHSANIGERLLLVRGTLCLSVLGIVAFLVSGQVAVVVAMNAPLLAIIGKEFFTK